MKKLVLIVFIASLGGFIYLTRFPFLDSEYRDGLVLEKVRSIYKILLTHKQKNGIYPSSLEEININPSYCFLFHCYQIFYNTFNNRQAVAMAVAVTDPWVVHFSSDCPMSPDVNEQHASICASYALKENYSGENNNWPIYLKDKLFLSTPSAWPKL